MIAFCGLNCSGCDAHLATIKNSAAEKVETARKWSEMYQHDIEPEQINCRGCKSEGPRFFHCDICKIRQCCILKNIDHCAVCSDYICNELAQFIKLAPEAGQALGKLRP